MTEYKTFDDYVKNTFNIEPRELTHISPEEQKKKTVEITVDELINIWNELTELELKADKSEWHKVADGDLPSEEGGWVCNQDGLSCYFDWSGGFTMAIKIYLSGKMSGLTEEEYTRNFQRAALHYQAKGFRVVNPCDLSEKVLRDNPNATYEDFMTRDLVALRTCTHIALIDGWQTSPGAQREKAEAERLGLEVLLYSA